MPHLVVSDAAAAIAFYKQAFGAEEQMRVKAEDGKRVLHARLRLNGGIVMLNDDFPEWNAGEPRVPGPGRRSPVTIHLEVPDADAAFSRAVAAGATVTLAIADQFWGARYGKLRDPFGHEWSIGGPLKGS
jgi:PhnB protein